jgi:hypothetical protein
MNINIDSPNNNIERLAADTERSRQKVQTKLGSFKGKRAVWWAGVKHRMPKWAATHIERHKILEKAVNEMRAAGQEEEIPEIAIRSLSESKEVMKKLAKKVDYPSYLRAISPETTTVDEGRLLTTETGKPIQKSQSEWHLNLGLLMNAYNQTKDPVIKKKIQFLALNYLAKAAPTDLSGLGLSSDNTVIKQLEEMFQFGANPDIPYHRETSVYESGIHSQLRSILSRDPSVIGSHTYLTDSTDYEDLLPLFYTVMHISKKEPVEEVIQSQQPEIEGMVQAEETEQAQEAEPVAETEQAQEAEPVVEAEQTHALNIDHLTEGWTNTFESAIVDHFQRNPDDPFNTYMSSVIIADLTSLIGEDIQTNRDPTKEATFSTKITTIKEGIETAIDQAILNIKEKHPELCQTPEDEQKIRVFLKFHITCICRTEINDIAVLKPIQIFNNPSHFLLPEGITDFLNLNDSSSLSLARKIIGDSDALRNQRTTEFVNISGIRLGGVSGRQKIFNFMDLSEYLRTFSEQSQMTEYVVRGKNVEAFKKDEVTTSVLFQRFKTTMNNEELVADKPQVAILGKATADIFEGLMTETSDEKWADLNADPGTRMILQQSLFRFMIHINDAERNIGDFTKFSLAIELAQSEIATILAITSPFKEEDFQDIYRARLDIVPDQFKDKVKAGVTKSAMNTFTGINAAVREINPALERAHGKGAYFEEVGYLGENKTTQDILNNSEIKSIDLYIGEFHHNIDIHMDHDHYTPGAVGAEIKQLLDQKKDTKHLTVAIDCTIDFINSPHAKALLEEFSKEIEDGKLNFVFFRSGQKFDMLGVDNYYGSSFWMVNNGGTQWKSFDRLTTSDAHKTDSLSMQWFCLANKYAPKSLDDYRGRIFANARSILNQVPADFKSGGQYADRIRVSTVDEEMQPSFIDIKILHPNCANISEKMKERLAERFAKAKAKVHARSSFGFAHANLNIIADGYGDGGPRNVRINPGLNPEENQIILDFIQLDIPAILQEFPISQGEPAAPAEGAEPTGQA